MAKVRVRTMRVVHTMNGSTVLFYSFQNPPHNGEMGDTVRASVHAQRGNIQETLKITRPLSLLNPIAHFLFTLLDPLRVGR